MPNLKERLDGSFTTDSSAIEWHRLLDGSPKVKLPQANGRMSGDAASRTDYRLCRASRLN